jgi:predicted RNase H-like HicB family nuclease
MKKDIYRYPALFDYADDGITVYFPDIDGCVTCASTEEEALSNAEEALSATLLALEDLNKNIPEPSMIHDLHPKANQVVVLITVIMTKYRKAISTKVVNKTVTIPQWLNDLAMLNKVNFSEKLRQALEHDLVKGL